MSSCSHPAQRMVRANTPNKSSSAFFQPCSSASTMHPEHLCHVQGQEHARGCPRFPRGGSRVRRCCFTRPDEGIPTEKTAGVGWSCPDSSRTAWSQGSQRRSHLRGQPWTLVLCAHPDASFITSSLGKLGFVEQRKSCWSMT